MQIDTIIILFFSVTFTTCFFLLFFKIDRLSKKVDKIENNVNLEHIQNERFKDAQTVRELIERKCNEHLHIHPSMSAELKLACKRGIEIGSIYYKQLYIKKKFDKEHERDMIINILKDIRSSVTHTNIEFYENDKKEVFLQTLRNNLSYYAELIISDIESFRSGNYNGKTFETFVEMAVKHINNIITITNNLYFQFNAK
jgi:hypothetical protein